jgi:hypothetical protein
MMHTANIAEIAQNAFGKQETKRQKTVVSRRTHCRGQRFTGNANLERFFNDDVLRLANDGSIAHDDDIDAANPFLNRHARASMRTFVL